MNQDAFGFSPLISRTRLQISQRRYLFNLSSALLGLLLFAPMAGAQGTAFTYQGRLQDSGTVANGSYDFQFTLWDALSGGTQQPQPSPVTVSRNTVQVSNGVFTTSLDFGASAFPGTDRFLEISVRPAGGASFTILSPRQQISSTPYAVRSLSASSVDNIPVSAVPAGSGNYIQNQSASPQAADFNISGNSTIAGWSAIGPSNLFSCGTCQLQVVGDTNRSGVVGYSANKYGVFGWGSTGIGVYGYSSSGLAGLFESNVLISGAQNPQLRLESTDSSVWAETEYKTGSSFWRTGMGGSTVPNDVKGKYYIWDGTGNAFRMIVDTNGNIGIGTTAPSSLLHLKGANPVRILGDTNTLSGTEYVDFFARTSIYNSDLGGMRIQRQTATGDVDTILFAAKSGNSASEVMRVKGNGSVGIGTTNSTGAYKFHVEGDTSGIAVYGHSESWAGVIGESNSGPGVSGGSINGIGVYGSSTYSTAGYFKGKVVITQVAGAGTNYVCRNASNEIADCSSSLRYKNHVQAFAGGLNIINRLRPIAFNWKQNGSRDLGLAAEEVEQVEPLLTFHNDKGEIEGVKYDRLSGVFINAFKEQQAQIGKQQDQLKRQQDQINRQDEEAQRQRAAFAAQQQQLSALKKLVCRSHRRAAVCK